jgi:hypothetical protein
MGEHSGMSDKVKGIPTGFCYQRLTLGDTYTSQRQKRSKH